MKFLLDLYCGNESYLVFSLYFQVSMDTTDQKPIDTETVISLLDEEQIKRLLTRRNRMNSLQSGVSPKVDIEVKNMKVYVFSCILITLIK